MIASEARIAANRLNATKSTGPRTEEGKAVSRRNALKHGLAGAGVVLASDHAAEVARRHEALEAELAPATAMGAILVLDLAVLSVRMERAARQEAAAVAERVRHAADDFDEQRYEQAEELMAALADQPRRSLRRLRKSPEGLELLLDAWLELRLDLTNPEGPRWAASHLARAAALLGLGEQAAPSARVGVLSRAAWGDFAGLGPHDGPAQGEAARRSWARARLLEVIDGAVAALEADAGAIDYETIELDRAEAGGRALFDPSPKANLARRYESDARRGFYRALKEFRRVEAEAQAQAAHPAEPAPPASPPPPHPEARLASSRAGEPADQPRLAPPLRATTSGFDRPEFEPSDVVRHPDGRPLTIGRPAPRSS